jgi:hypothetical protein
MRENDLSLADNEQINKGSQRFRIQKGTWPANGDEGIPLPSLSG